MFWEFNKTIFDVRKLPEKLHTRCDATLTQRLDGNHSRQTKIDFTRADRIADGDQWPFNLQEHFKLYIPPKYDFYYLYKTIDLKKLSAFLIIVTCFFKYKSMNTIEFIYTGYWAIFAGMYNETKRDVLWASNVL